MIGFYNPAIRRVDRVVREYNFFGAFRCDLAIGDSEAHAYTFVELEDAGTRSLFVKQGEKLARGWSPRFEHGYTQVVDWFYKLDDLAGTAELEARLGGRSVDYTGVLVVGRDQHMDAGESSRLRWRRERTIVISKRIVCVTYDQLHDDLTFRLDMYAEALKAGG